MSDIDLLGLIMSEDSAGDQWRLVRPLLRLRQAGIEARCCTLETLPLEATDPERTVLIARAVTGSSYVAIDRWLEQMRRRIRAVVFEVDDLFWGEDWVTHMAGAGFVGDKGPDVLIREGEMARYMMARCDGVIVSSDPLADLVRAFVDCPVVTVPNAIDLRWFRCQMSHRPPWADYLTIGWAGGRRPEADLAPMAEAWGRIARRYPDVRFVIAASLVPDLFYRAIDDTDRIIRLPWLPWNEYPLAYQVDIGCCAVADTPFNRCKTPIKAWEYAAAGAAVVATPMLYGDGHLPGLFLAETADEWERALAILITRQTVRTSLAEHLSRHVERHSLDHQCTRWLAAAETILGYKTCRSWLPADLAWQSVYPTMSMPECLLP
jgi:glycosyltransferase involved in cell wall biosynthesis